MYDTTKPYRKKIFELIQQTWKTPYISVEKGIVRKKFDYLEIHHNDGIGTKGVYHWEAGSYREAVTDAMAMNLNDLAMLGATPYAVIDHLFLPVDDKKSILNIIKTLVIECKKREIAITGGETAIHNNMVGLELNLTILGFVKNPRINKLKEGDVLIGLESNGLHSNGFTKVREVLGEDYNIYLSQLTKPTRIYSNLILELIKDCNINCAQHIAGGAFTKFKDLLENTDLLIKRDHSLEPQKIFKTLYEKGISDKEMYKTFNCGIGFVISSSEYESYEILSKISNYLKADIIGKVISGSGKIKIESKFSDNLIEF